MRTRIILLAAAFAAACTTQNNSALVITKVVPPISTDSSTGTPPVTTTTCSFDPGADEVSFLTVNLSENKGSVGAVVQNFIGPTNTDNSLNLDASTFLPHQAVLSFEFPGSGPPTGVTVKSPIIVPVSGVEVPGGTAGTVAMPMFPKGVVTGAVPDGAFISVTFHVEGKLASGVNARTSEREYIFQACTAPGCGFGGAGGAANRCF